MLVRFAQNVSSLGWDTDASEPRACLEVLSNAETCSGYFKHLIGVWDMCRTVLVSTVAETPLLDIKMLGGRAGAYDLKLALHFEVTRHPASQVRRSGHIRSGLSN